MSGTGEPDALKGARPVRWGADGKGQEMYLASGLPNYLQNGCFPDTYEEMQPIPVLKAGVLPYAGDDGPAMGQTYRMSYDLDQKKLTLALRTPNVQGTWVRTWRENTCQMRLPDLVVERAQAGKTLAPSLREIAEADGTRYAVLDFIVEVPVASPVTFEEIQTVLGFDWGVRVLVTASVVEMSGHQIGRPFFLDTGPFDGRQARLRRQIDQLKAKVARLEWQQPRHTSHVCPRCGNPANTSTSPQHRSQINDWGAWLCCSHPACLWNGSRDYAASVNIARLGAALIRHAQKTSRVKHPQITHPSVQPVSYMGTRAALRLPPLSPRGHLIASGRIYCNGWRLSVSLRSSYATPIMLRLCG
jgi:hypothetical protein